MPDPIEAQIDRFFDDLQAHAPYLAFARQVEAAGCPQWARLLRVIARSEEVRLNLARKRFFSAAQAHAADNFFVCPECGLIVAGETPEGCPVCHTPPERFVLVE